MQKYRGSGGLPLEYFRGHALKHVGKCSFLKQNIAFFQKLEIQKLRGLFLFPDERLYGNTKKTQSQAIMRRIYPVWAT